ncbi:MAG: hypothetical protein WC627_09975 [Legionella sp.]|jgi:hypothetical protein
MNLFEVLKPFETENDTNKKKAILEDIIKKFDAAIFSKTDEINLYALFGLEKNQLLQSGLSELHQAFRNLSFKIHTDRIGKNLPYYEAAGDLFKKLSDARVQIMADIEATKTNSQKPKETSQKQSNNNNNNHKNKNQSKNSSHDKRPYESPYSQYYRNQFNNPGFFPTGAFYVPNFTNIPPNFYPYPPNMNPGASPSFFKPFQPSTHTDVVPTIFEEVTKNHIKTHKLDGKLIVNGSVYGQLICTHSGEVHIMGQVTGNLVAKRAHVIVHGVATGNIKSEYGSITVMNNVSGTIVNIHANNTINGDLLVGGSVTNQHGCNIITGQTLGSINNITGINSYYAPASDGYKSTQNNNNFSK